MYSFFRKRGERGNASPSSEKRKETRFCRKGEKAKERKKKILVYFLVFDRKWTSGWKRRANPCIRFLKKEKKEETRTLLVRKERKHVAVKGERKSD